MSSSQSEPKQPSSHRLPTVSASQALYDLRANGPECISSGIHALDRRLICDGNGTNEGGFERGRVTELWGPSGAGKTAIALQAAVNCVEAGHRVVWLDCSTPLHPHRLSSVLTASQSQTATTPDSSLERIHHLSIPTLSHLLALLLHPKPTFPPPSTALLVLENVHAPFTYDYPRANGSSDAARWRQSRRYAVLESIGAALSKLAALHRMAVVVTTGCATRGRPGVGVGGGAVLVPGIAGGSAEWTSALRGRVVVFRDRRGRFVGVQRHGGKWAGGWKGEEDTVGAPGWVVGFEIWPSGGVGDRNVGGSGGVAEQGGAREKTVEDETATVTIMSSPVKGLSKGRKRVYDQVADSEEEEVDEYGWGEGDEDALAAEGLMDSGQRQAVDPESAAGGEEDDAAGEQAFGQGDQT